MEKAKIVAPFDAQKPLPFTVAQLEELDDEHREPKWTSLNANQLERFTIQMYRQGAYSPTFVAEAQVMPGIEIIDTHEEAQRVARIRNNKGENSSKNTVKKIQI